MSPPPLVTQRAYTLRLRGADPQDTSWREALWLTHEAVNKGAKVFGDWLLTLRGGLDHKLADAKIPQGKGKPDRDPTNDERKARRIVLALSWLSVESERGAPANYIVPHDLDKQSGTRSNWKTIEALKEILQKRGVDDPDEMKSWLDDCSASLSAAIRDDAVWVNRSQAFDDAAKLIGSSLTRDEIWDMLERFFGSREAYLAPAKGSEDESSETEQEEQAKDLVQKAGQWLSSRFGTGTGADFGRMAQVYEKIAEWAGKAQSQIPGKDAVADLAAFLGASGPASDDLNRVLGLISGPGYKSATRNHLTRMANSSVVTAQDLKKLGESASKDANECLKKVGSKGPRHYADAILKGVESACGFTYLQKNGPARHSEFAVMLDHAARRVSLAHTWIKLAEAERWRFEEDAQKIREVPSCAREWLDNFCSARSKREGALEPYRIRRRAIDGWDRIVWAWAKCASQQERIEAITRVQAESDANDEKFGDAQLFEALASDDALCVWHAEGNEAKDPDPQILTNYVLATEAEENRRRFKVPAYRHPDALLHPVFCDFGMSRWDIKFGIHEAYQQLQKTIRKGVRTRSTSSEVNEQSVETNTQTVPANASAAYANQLPNTHALSMTLWTGTTIAKKDLWWHSKRLMRDLALQGQVQEGKPTEVTRADRLGRAAAGVSVNSPVSIAALFEEKEWNGRLQAPRAQLEAIASRVAKHGWDDKAKKMRDRIEWLITFSARLQPRGPWYEYAERMKLKSDPQYWPHAEANKSRKGGARLILSRLPGLRILSVDLGHRYAAACAVWETLSVEQIQAACKAAGCSTPTESDLYLLLKNGARTTVYRRIGADTLPDGTPHPAPWAKLDRQFLIKLQGEDRDAREASNEEIWAVHQMECLVDRFPPLIDRLVNAGWDTTHKQKQRLEALKQLGWIPIEKHTVVGDSNVEDEDEYFRPSLAVDELMSSAVRTMRLALQRHGRRARIAFNFITRKKFLPGGQEIALTSDGRVELLTETLADWHALFNGNGWADEWARQLWETLISRWLQGVTLPSWPKGADATPKARKEYEADLTKSLKSVAERLAQNNSLCGQLCNLCWKTRWYTDDVVLQKKCLRWLRGWILPQGKRAKADRAIRHVGGLSITRIATIKSLYQVQKAFHMRPDPQNPRKNIPSRGDDALVDFGRRILDAMEHMREQRVKQLASRIVEAALGIGRMKKSENGKDPKRPRERVDEPCHAVVIENLTHYRPEETRMRRENRQLMSWSAAKVKKYLAESCELNGLHLREVQASYTSRQDSRTGAPGLRCQDVPLKEFMHSPFWRKQVAQAQKNQAAGKGDARDRFLCDLDAKWAGKSLAELNSAGNVRVPLAGGELFVSADPTSPAAKGIQADLNAAANIGLKALLDPDWAGSWWYVPCDPITFKPVKDKVGGCSAISTDKPLRSSEANTRKDRRKGEERAKEIVNLWCDVAASKTNVDDSTEQNRNWREFAPYWNDVQARVVKILRQKAGLPEDSANNSSPR